ncbi:MAG: hypothetical protein P4L35_17450 [Ignavibacteriaceae bacterium]|nr:hypothetical protein [Ignavibacteriaceae bacterium]
MLNKFTLFLLLAGLTAFYACKDKLVDNPNPNQPPTTKIFLNPDSTISLQQSNIHLYWSGDDPDGTVMGFYFSWDGIHWSFTTKNDSLFSLQIGAVDTIYSFRVAAVDNSGSGKYISDVYQNGIHFGPEPFTDLNGNGKWDAGEPFVDIGLIDPHPARLKVPIKNTAPTVAWDALSTHPDTSYTAMTFGWDAADIDGDANHGVNTIQSIHIALNDTNKFVSLNGTVSVVTIRTSGNPLMDIYINGDVTDQPVDSAGHKIQLAGLAFNSNNIFYVQAQDISGAKSPWISSATQPKSNPGWFVKKPQGTIGLVNNYAAYDNPGNFYPEMMDSINYKYDVIDLVNQTLPYINITFLETVKLFKGILWYTDNNPSLDLANATVQKISAAGVKIFFTMLFPQTLDVVSQVQGFLPIRSDSSSYLAIIAPNKIISDTNHVYPTLKVSTSFPRVRAFFLNSGDIPIYYFPNKELAGFIGFENSDKSIFFIGAPLHKMIGNPGSVAQLLTKVFFQDFNITP